MKEFKFSIPITVRISDINAANHVGYQNYFLFFQEARIAYLNQFGFSELNIDGFGMIISAVDCQYKQELHFRDDITVQCRVSHVNRRAFIMEYRIVRADTICATGTTTNLCFDYGAKKIVPVPQAFVRAVKEFEGID